MQRYQWKLILILLNLLAKPVLANEQDNFENGLKKALSTLKQQQLEKTRSTIASLIEQVESDLEPSKRMQAALMLAAHYWSTNYRLSRHYLGIAESLSDPTAADLRVFNPEIEHMKIRFRQAALLDAGTKQQIEAQLKLQPVEPLRLSLVEMLLETNDALALGDDFLDSYKKYYISYPRTIRKDRFLKRAAELQLAKKDFTAYYKQMESLLDQYPVTEEGKWALDQLLNRSLTPEQGVPSYAFTYGLLKKVYRNSSHDPQQQKRILELLHAPLRKNNNAVSAKLDTIETLRIYCFLQIYDEALSYAQTVSAQKETPAALKAEIQNWVAFIHSERGDHNTALVQFRPTLRGSDSLMFQESEAKSFMSSQNFLAAATHYEGLLKKKDQPRYRWYYFWNLLASGRTDNAQTFASRQPDRMFTEVEFRGDAAKYWQGKALLSSGKIDQAQTAMQTLLERSNPGYYGVLAKAAVAQSMTMTPGKGAQPILANFVRSADPSAEEIKGTPAERPDQIPFSKNVFDIAKTMEIDPFLVLSIVRSESAFNSRALSNAGAQGLMQIMPYTAVRMARMLDDRDFKLEQLQSGETNLVYGSLYLALLLNYYNGHAIPAVAAYNAGPTVVNKWLRECRNCPIDAFVEFIPYAETRNYVKKVMSTYTGYRLSETHSLPEFVLQELPNDFSKQASIF